MSKHVRIRCPICGMLSWQSRLDKEWEFEVVIQDTFSRGRGRISHRYYQPETEEGVWLLKLALVDKMRAVVRELEGEVRDEKHDLWAEKWADGEYDDARLISGTYHTEFDVLATAIKGLTSTPRVEVFLAPVTVEDPDQVLDEVVREVASPGILSRFDFGTVWLQNATVREEDIAASTTLESAIHRLDTRRFSVGSQGAADGIAGGSTTLEDDDEEVKTKIEFE